MKYVFIVAVFLFVDKVFAQTYATPELRLQAEKWDAEKNAKTPSVQDTKSEPVKVFQPTVFDIALLKDAYRLKKIEAIDVDGKHTPEEMVKFNVEAQREFDKEEYSVDLSNNVMYIVRRSDRSKFRKMEFIITDSILHAKDCIECKDNTYKVINKTASLLLLQLKPQNEGQYFIYQFNFENQNP